MSQQHYYIAFSMKEIKQLSSSTKGKSTASSNKTQQRMPQAASKEMTDTEEMTPYNTMNIFLHLSHPSVSVP